MTENLCNINSPFEHGGDIHRVAEELGIPDRKVIDFSVSVNPLGVSKKIKAEIRKHLKYIQNYPDPDTQRLRKRIAQLNGVEPESVLCGNGSTELIYLTAKTLRPKKILITAPTFSEYENACRINSESGFTFYELNKENNFDISPDEFIRAMSGEASCDTAFICNPNNPTGRLLKKEDVIKIADAARERCCYLIVDEAFIDFTPEDSVIDQVKGNPYLIVLRTLSNFYALPGLRIGYGVFPQDLIGRLKEYKEPWTVNSLAQRAAVAALNDKVYRNETFRLLKEEQRFLERSFRKMGIEFIRSDTNFYLLKMDNAQKLCRHLRTKGILIRDCSNFRGLDTTYLRVAVKSHKENAVLIKMLGLLKNQGKDYHAVQRVAEKR